MPARIIVLGGAGDMGFHIVKVLAGDKRVDEVVIGDINVKAAEVKLRGLGDLAEKVSIERVDVWDSGGAIKLLKRFDSVASAIGPFYMTAAHVAGLAIKAGVNLVDLCDDYDGYESTLRLNSEAEREGVTIISGLGWTPGLSNILAKEGCVGIGGCKSIRIYWSGSAADSEGYAVILHVFHAMTGNVPQFIDGRLQWIPAGSGREVVDFGDPIGKAPTYYTGHPEPLSIPTHLNHINEAIVKGGLIPDYQNKLVKIMEKLRLITDQRRRRVASLIHRIENIFRVGGVKASGLLVKAANSDKEIVYRITDRMGRLTGIPAAIGAILLSKGSIEPGVFPPEAIIDTKPFLEELRGKGLSIKRETH